ncbi:MAG TPA: hypothetical protein VGO07_01305 [Candidatus Saccharimonadales bacterium]|jgi:hypothetical protein|nr:hypothetical protein [Candidatus Saccharimonadales bacterium]
MAKRTPPLADRLFAGLIERSSAYCVDHPDSAFAQWLVGDNPVLWHATRTHAADVPGWHHFDGDPNASVRRSTFIKGVRFEASDFDMMRALSSLEREHGGRPVPAAAFAVRAAVVVAEIPGYTGNRLIPPEEIRYKEAAILGLGGGALDATLGAFHPDANEFVGSLNVSASELRFLQDLTTTFPNTPKL